MSNPVVGVENVRDAGQPESLLKSLDRLYPFLVTPGLATVEKVQPQSRSPQANLFSLRKGKWSEEEEALTKRLISSFNSGLLQVPVGTTLRTYLSERLFW